MPAQVPPGGPAILATLREAGTAADGAATLRLDAETATVSKRVRRTLVRAATSTSTRQEAVEASLARVDVVVRRVPVGRVVDAVPPIRVEGDVTIMPIVEEQLILVRRLVLKEEVHVATVCTLSRQTRSVTLRQQSFTVTRPPLDD